MIQPVYHTLSVLSSALWAQFNHRVPCALPGLSTDSAERRGSSCGHVHCRCHSGRWPTLCYKQVLKGRRINMDGIN